MKSSYPGNQPWRGGDVCISMVPDRSMVPPQHPACQAMNHSCLAFNMLFIGIIRIKYVMTLLTLNFRCITSVNHTIC